MKTELRNKNTLNVSSRILVVFASVALIAVFFLPAWRIDLFAPQYPEGLTMNIWINGLSGDVDVINGLNHYIGMKHITVEMFPEFRFLPYVVVFFMVLGMLVAITGKRKFLLAYLVLTAIGGAAAMYDFYQWGYDYGHNLDPKAPIQVPGLSYQPPLIGHKRLLNFDAYSFPDVGGWVVIGAAVLAFMVWLFEWYHDRKKIYTPKKVQRAVVTAMLVLFVSCSTKPEPFQPGKDVCYFCKMGITDTRFGGEVITKKGKLYKFDDLHCMISFLKTGGEAETDIAKKLAVNWQKPNEFIDVTAATFVTSPELKSPMASNTAGFENKQSAENYAAGKLSEITIWQEAYNKIK
ncbi:MAG: nitrous oxide reductase accessory protein NosL [Chitinophagaceae bacterium]|nr:nitrous oxide reductase accessory protein NosL [Chitinophagaceae bacterium]